MQNCRDGSFTSGTPEVKVEAHAVRHNFSPRTVKLAASTGLAGQLTTLGIDRLGRSPLSLLPPAQTRPRSHDPYARESCVRPSRAIDHQAGLCKDHATSGYCGPGRLVHLPARPWRLQAGLGARPRLAAAAKAGEENASRSVRAKPRHRQPSRRRDAPLFALGRR